MFIRVTPVAESMDDVVYMLVNVDHIRAITVEELEDGEFANIVFKIGPDGEFVSMSVRESPDALLEQLRY